VEKCTLSRVQGLTRDRKRFEVVGCDEVDAFYHILDSQKISHVVDMAKDLQTDIEKLEMDVECLTVQLNQNIKKLDVDLVGLEGLWKQRIKHMHMYNEIRDIGVRWLFQIPQETNSWAAKHNWKTCRDGTINHG
jgi:hypothetical protein